MHSAAYRAARETSTDTNTARDREDAAPRQTQGQDDSEGFGAAAPIILIATLLAMLGGGYAFKGQISGFLETFIQVVDGWGPYGCVLHPVLPLLVVAIGTTCRFL